jgi:hypothetical protein
LQEVAPIARWTTLPERAACGEGLSFPPFIAWTYQQPSEELAKFLRQLDFQKNGVLTPQREPFVIRDERIIGYGK